MQEATGDALKRLIAIAASLALLAWLAADARWRTVGGALAALTPATLAIAGGGLLASYLLRAARVHDEFRRDAGGGFGTCLRIVLMHNAMVNVVPFRGGEAAFPVLLRQSFGTPLGRAVASLFWFRLQDALIVAILAVLIWPGLPLALRVIGVAGLVGFAWYLPRWARAPHDWADRHGLHAKLAKLRDAFAESTRHARLGWVWTIANWSVKLAAQAFLLATLLPAAGAVGAAGALGAELAAILPVQGVAGFGTYEAGAAAALLPHGISFDEGLRAALALHLFVIACAVGAGGVAWLVSGASAAPDGDQSPVTRKR
ncbi:MAG TPA: lysylphosphatidylglycerol synthase domain-containing protein [Aromatoleum sp.]|uniref:lysylphosphatidylglycerol synthase domain-containing protein n=1 Tax=Aromatoleum sp. TaxID=2307007 RepID=UPI002B47EE30|nr:lysylphosphatidylglycerol synthase domain-containing protein [Aromatoleum sp.]HJV24252.1 lysylphosphatidylglycerol synthase domain-containing protein [Aromatoleum sp.]